MADPRGRGFQRNVKARLKDQLTRPIMPDGVATPESCGWQFIGFKLAALTGSQAVYTPAYQQGDYTLVGRKERWQVTGPGDALDITGLNIIEVTRSVFGETQ